MFGAGARNEDFTVGAGLLPVGVCCKELGTDTHSHILWFSEVSAMLRCCILPAITTLKVIIKRSVEFCTLFLNITLLDDKNQSLYSQRDLGTSSGCFWGLEWLLAVWPWGQAVFPSIFFFFFFFLPVSWGLNIAGFWASDKINFPIV